MEIRLGSPLLLGLLTLLSAGTAIGSEPTPKGSIVRVERAGDGFRLKKDGAPYLIRGVGGNGDLRTLKEAGGNSIRTWGADDLGEVLDRAHALGLTVAAGIWLGTVKDGFRYDDPKSLETQRAMVRAVVQKHKDHPALLLWCLGNEMELDAGDVPRVWSEVNELARIVKHVDPNHPTMTAVAGVNRQKIDRLNSLCPDLDVLGLNTYEDIALHLGRLKDAGWNRPFIVTEFGPAGWWKGKKTAWGAPIEQTSTEKAEAYLAAYFRPDAIQPGLCLGSYAFFWGHKHEGTATWFGMLLPGGERLGAVDAMTFAWTGRWPEDLAPRILFLDTDAEGREVPPATAMDAVVAAYDLDGDPLVYRWEVIPESPKTPSPAVPGSIVAAEGRRLRFQTPKAEGAYRLVVTVLDGRGHAATANAPFFVKAGAKP